jgi:hypothetical protein
LKKSPLAFDIYTWLTYRYSYLTTRTLVPWEGLQLQFGSDYRRLDNFQRKFSGALAKVAKVYPEATFTVERAGIQLVPSGTHIAKRPSRLDRVGSRRG